MTFQEKVKQWKSFPFDKETQLEVIHLEKKTKELEEAFYKDLEFGTGGIRGVMGVGTNRINKYTIGKNAQAVAFYLQKKYPNEALKVVIAYDCRKNSDSLAKVVAEIFSANGVRSYLFSSLRPTPELSYAVRTLNTHCGIVLTASHNPLEYNGFKVYSQCGGQIVPPEDQEIIAISQQTSFEQIKFTSNPDLISLIDHEIDHSYVKEICQFSKSSKTKKKDFSIVFTALHGTSATLMPSVYKEAGFQNIHFLESQQQPDGNFPTVKSPNPEEKEALNLAIEKAKEIGADLVIGTDPDADRFGIAVKETNGTYYMMNGNQTMVLLTDYILKQKKWTPQQFIGSTVVSTPLMPILASYYGVECKLSLTGFKWIGKMIKEAASPDLFIAGGEESNGYLVGSAVRDKDAISSSLMISEIGADLKAENKSLKDYLIDIYLRHGLFTEKLYSFTKLGKKGKKEIQKMMHGLRNNKLEEVEGVKVVFMEDYIESKRYNSDNSIEILDLPKSDLLRFYLADGSFISIRPSGTEPKIKYYIQVRTSLDSMENFDSLNQAQEEKCNRLFTFFSS